MRNELSRTDNGSKLNWGKQIGHIYSSQLLALKFDLESPKLKFYLFFE